MNFLQICQRARRESGLSSQIGSTESQTGEAQRVVEWCQNAWSDIQEAADWDWLQADFSFATSASDWDYPPADSPLSLTRFGKWDTRTFRVYKTSEGQSTEQYLVEEDWHWFRDSYRFGGMATETGRPTVFAIRPEDRAIALGVVPDGSYTITGRYWKSPEQITGNTTTPAGIPSQYHMLIVWRALMEYAGFDAASEVYMRARANYQSLYARMADRHLPDLSTGRPLA